MNMTWVAIIMCMGIVMYVHNRLGTIIYGYKRVNKQLILFVNYFICFIRNYLFYLIHP